MVLFALAGCARGAGTSPGSPRTPAAGISIAMYQDTADPDRAGAACCASSVVDDRRWITLAGNTLVLDHLDPGAVLSSLLIEPLVGGALDVGRCARARLEPAVVPGAAPLPIAEPKDTQPPALEVSPEPAPDDRARGSTILTSEVRCDVRGAPGRYLVRVLYVTSSLSYRVQHDVTMTAADRATTVTRFAFATPAWGGRGDVILYDGMPGTDHPPHEVARGAVTLDGSTAVLTAPAHDSAAQLRRVFDGALRNGAVAPNDGAWARDSVQAVWVWLELEGLELVRGPLHAHIELPGEPIRDIDVPALGRENTGAALRFPLWIDEQLRGIRKRVVGSGEQARLVDRFVLSIINTGDSSREVWIEEHLRHARRRELKHAWPGKSVVAGDRVRSKLVVAPGTVERTGYVIEYSF